MSGKENFKVWDPAGPKLWDATSRPLTPFNLPHDEVPNSKKQDSLFGFFRGRRTAGPGAAELFGLLLLILLAPRGKRGDLRHGALLLEVAFKKNKQACIRIKQG